MLYRIESKDDKTSLAPVSSSTLKAEGLYEVKDLSQWLVATPRFLAYNLNDSEIPIVLGWEVPISPEFRVDILGVDSDGTLVVCEVKRDENDPLYQALQYCGRLFSMPTSDLVELVQKYAKKDLNEIQALLALPEDSTLTEMWDSGRRPIRLVIVAQDYSLRVLQTARWLATTGMRVSCVRFDCFKDGNNRYLMPQQILPSVETAESYAIQREVAHRQAQVRTRNVFYSLIAKGLLIKDEKVYSQDGKDEIGVVRDDHIERVSDGTQSVNCQQLTGISGMWSVCVRRGGKMTSLAELRQTSSVTQAAVPPPAAVDGIASTVYDQTQGGT